MIGTRYFLPLFLLCTAVVTAQTPGDDLFMPRDIRRACDRETRTTAGVPGPEYWQNGADYDIRVRVEPQSRLLSGEETITYHNNSPDELEHLVLKLHQNMNRTGAARWNPIGARSVTGGVVLRSVSYEGQTFPLKGSKQLRVDGGNLILTPEQPLQSGADATIAVSWEFTIPVATGEDADNPRMGVYENASMFIGYWYPKVAVYDDVHGWDMHSYDGEHEFYNDYGDMEVAITVPENWGVWATGGLQNPAEVLREPVLTRYREARIADTVMQIINPAEAAARNSFIGTNGYSTWKYKADDVPDFAFGVALGYCWDGVTAANGDGRTFVDAVYDPLTESFRTVANEGRITVEMLSREFPGVAFPYQYMTVFNGNSGMEFPMIVNDGQFPNRILNVYVHAHEITHMYFPFMVGVDETRYAWMDEGMAYFLPIEAQEKMSNYNHLIRAARTYERFAGTEQDYPLMIPATASGGNQLQILAYTKPALAFAILRDAMGSEKFAGALREFVRRWKGKHPLPWDFFYTFNHVNGSSLNWFWKPWFFESGWPDLGIGAVERDGSLTTITVRREGSMPIPVRLLITFEGGGTKEIEQSAMLWKDGAPEVQFRLDHQEAIFSIRLGADWIPDSDPSNNEWKP